MTRRKYTTEFKQQALELAQELGSFAEANRRVISCPLFWGHTTFTQSFIQRLITHEKLCYQSKLKGTNFRYKICHY